MPALTLAPFLKGTLWLELCKGRQSAHSLLRPDRHHLRAADGRRFLLSIGLGEMVARLAGTGAVRRLAQG